MKFHLDSAQVLAFIGSAAGFALANFDRIAATGCALVGLGYTLWRWRKEARRADRPPADS